MGKICRSTGMLTILATLFILSGIVIYADTSGQNPVVILKTNVGCDDAITVPQGQPIVLSVEVEEGTQIGDARFTPSQTFTAMEPSYTCTAQAAVEYRDRGGNLQCEVLPSNMIIIKLAEKYSLSVSTYTYPEGGENGGTVNPSKGEYYKGEKVTITASPAS
ncbi:MAG: hypothetical protein V1789_05765, partial [PVC group bacterium]